jgi:hypothetical protein
MEIAVCVSFVLLMGEWMSEVRIWDLDLDPFRKMRLEGIFNPSLNFNYFCFDLSFYLYLHPKSTS